MKTEETSASRRDLLLGLGVALGAQTIAVAQQPTQPSAPPRSNLFSS
jgi:hypothetical protein